MVYIGTFSKTLYPGLRLGYVVIPRPLVSDLKHAHAELYRGGHSLIQMALAEFITAGHYSAHIRRMRLLYSRRRAFLTELIQRHCMPYALSDFSDNAGLHLILNLPAEADDVAIAREANARHILVRPLSRYYLTAARKKGLLMGFASQPEEQMRRRQRLTRLPADALPADAPAPGGRRKTKRPNLRRGVIGEPDIRYQAGVAYQASIAARSFFMAFFSS